MDKQSERMVEIIKAEFKLRVLDESLSRIELCMSKLSDADLWHRPNENSNSVGNLIMHLEGNIRQYVISGVGGEKDVRKRPEEFEPENKKSRTELFDKLYQTLLTANKVVQQLAEEKFAESVSIQGFEHTRLSAILHVVEHLSYHVGQITYYTKAKKNIDTAYYGNMDLDVTG